MGQGFQTRLQHPHRRGHPPPTAPDSGLHCNRVRTDYPRHPFLPLLLIPSDCQGRCRQAQHYLSDLPNPEQDAGGYRAIPALREAGYRLLPKESRHHEALHLNGERASWHGNQILPCRLIKNRARVFGKVVHGIGKRHPHLDFRFRNGAQQEQHKDRYPPPPTTVGGGIPSGIGPCRKGRQGGTGFCAGHVPRCLFKGEVQPASGHLPFESVQAARLALGTGSGERRMHRMRCVPEPGSQRLSGGYSDKEPGTTVALQIQCNDGLLSAMRWKKSSYQPAAGHYESILSKHSGLESAPAVQDNKAACRAGTDPPRLLRAVP